MDSVRPCKNYLQAIRDFPTPKNLTCAIMVWTGEPGVLRIQYGRAYAALSAAAETIQNIYLG